MQHNYRFAKPEKLLSETQWISFFGNNVWNTKTFLRLTLIFPRVISSLRDAYLENAGSASIRYYFNSLYISIHIHIMFIYVYIYMYINIMYVNIYNVYIHIHIHQLHYNVIQLHYRIKTLIYNSPFLSNVSEHPRMMHLYNVLILCINKLMLLLKIFSTSAHSNEMLNNINSFHQK